MRRRDFIKVVLGSAAPWSVAASAQQPERIRRIAILMNRAADDADGQARLAAFKQVLQQLGWSDGRNVHIDIRWGEDKIDLERKYAAELIALAPDIILASGTIRCQSCSRPSPIRSVLASSTAWPGWVLT